MISDSIWSSTRLCDINNNLKIVIANNNLDPCNSPVKVKSCAQGQLTLSRDPENSV